MTSTTAPDPERAPPVEGPKRVFLETFGCQMNLLDSELVQGELERRGYAFVSSSDDADVVLYNTCSVRELSEHKVVSRLGRMKKDKRAGRDVVVGVLGCMAERAGADLSRAHTHVDFFVGPSELDRVPDLVAGAVAHAPDATRLALSGHTSRRSSTLDAAMDRLEALDRGRFVDDDAAHTPQYVRITRGCNKFCSFCVVPYTRGPEVHKPADDVVAEVRRLVAGGAREVTLLGQTINHYAHDGTSFARLLARVHDEIPELPRLRFLTSYPRDFTDEALDVMASRPRICRFLHVPAQHGNDDVLRRMNRGYTRAMYLDLVRRARARMPDVAIVGDMIVGFPGETDADFDDSLSLLDEVAYKAVFVFKYSPRPGTLAERRDDDDVPDDVKKARNVAMLAHQQRISLRHHEAMIGRRFSVLVEGAAKIDPDARGDGADALVALGRKTARAGRAPGAARLSARTTGDHIVSFDGPLSLAGSIVDVDITAATGLSLTGALASG